MPIEFAPPAPELRPFAVPPPQYADPLETLSRMGQLKTQALTQQEVQLGIQQKQLELQSSQGLMRAWQDAGGDMDKLAQIAPNYGVIPSHLMTLQNTLAQVAKERAQTNLFGSEAKKNAMQAQDLEHDQLNQAYDPVWKADPLKQQALIGPINQRLIQQGWDPAKLLPSNATPDQIQQARSAYTTQNYIKTMAE